ncbi:TonB-dependent receptor [Mucilaginibacter myungsuensis]|uniref:TonB-dependent receptor n=1 Tax=Mucilaginibacter myungsuensis TaxID=649104 RepID=A0A929PZI5_9SPHI|nr:TonB-dependent receptor [Mucilaginibacter myungsuensis]MBE9664535.1 TonB-dependent receptor [Mucilaginibacter myungsuensis]MDN3601115.1 carboxypeptidase regulatory-like domain-containing protein [Mucilaginibacter myungsuensis]
MRKQLLVLIAAFFVTASAFAQVTTSSMTGTIKDSKETLIGATIKATFLPSGTVYGTATRADGRFAIQNMRSGGPYTVEVSFIGYQPQKFENVTLKLGEPYVLNVTLAQTGLTLNAVNIVANNPQSVLNSDRSGSTTNLGTREIMTLPSVTRNINDLTRLTPQASSNGQSIGGGNYRQNNITVDGGNFNNQFGIGTNLPGNGNPIPLDALEEISVNMNPSDVRQSGFIGSAINATTRSGTNEFSGSAYYYFRNENQVGTKVRSYAELVPAAQDVKIMGARIGGPIIKNKLFFFANIEKGEQPGATSSFRASSAAEPFPATTGVNRPTGAELDEISKYLRDTYGYETGGYQNYGYKTERLNIVGRLDWNINDKNRFNVRYSRLESKTPSFLSTSTNPLTGTVYPGGGNRGDNNALAFQNSNYFTENNFYSLSAELNSNFLTKFANTARFTYNNQNEPRSSDSQIFPFVDILKDGRPFTSFGYEPFTYGNLRDVQSYSFVDYVQWTEGRHNLLAGVQAEFANTRNGFQRFGTSYYIYNSFEDFKSANNPDPALRVNPLAYARTFSLSDGYKQAFPTFKTQNYSVYAQDDWNVSDKLRVSLGVRGTLYSYTQDALTHPLVAGLNFANGEKLNTGALPKSAFLISPRAGFNYDVKGDRSIQLRGSAGIYSGGIPNVWIVSQVSDAGMVQFSQVIQGQSSTPGPFNPNIDAYLPATPPVAGTSIPSALSFISPDIKAPQTFKASLAGDFKLGYGFTGTIEGLYNRDFRTVKFRNPNLVEPQRLNVEGYADNRMIYPNAVGEKYINVINSAGQSVANNAGNASQLGTYVLDNANSGYYWSVMGRIEKQFGRGFSASLAYIRSEAKSLFDGTGDQPSGSWLGTTSVNGSNNVEMGYAGFVVPNRIVASLTYRKEYLKHLGTSVTLFYDGSNQGRVSYTYSTDFNRDGANADLIYVPKDPSEITFTPFTAGTAPNAVTYTAQQQSDIFFRYIEQDPYLLSRKGKYAERNGGLLPWFNQLDANFFQDIFVNLGNKKRNTLQFSVTVENLLNFIDKDWGVRKTITQAQVLVPTNQASLTPGGSTKPTFRLNFDGSQPNAVVTRDVVNFTSTYRMQFGLRYIFN